MSTVFGKSSKSTEEIVAAVIDYGTLGICVAEKLAETYSKVYYHSNIDEEYRDIRDTSKGIGLDKVIRCDDIFEPDIFNEIDLFIFPDIGYSGLQKHLRLLGKAVWGAHGAGELELSRTFFLDVLKEAGLPIIKNRKIQGLTMLRSYLKENDDKWIKVNQYRRNMETWHHIDWDHSERMMDALAIGFGGMKDEVEFVVQDNIESDMEIGYDGWCVDGKFPKYSFQGYEKKNELYLGSVLADKDLPEEIRFVNEKMSPFLKEHGYRCWWATEIRVAKGVPYFIDPTARMPGQTGEHQLETITNLAEVIWAGANGELIVPEFMWNFAAEATLHYDGLTTDTAVNKEWKTLRLPENMMKWLKLYHYSKIDGLYHFTPESHDEVGVVLGVGDSVEESIDHLKENLEELKDIPIHANIAGFASLLESIQEAEDQEMKFGGDIPSAEKVLADVAKII